MSIIKGKRGKAKITKVKNEKGIMTTDPIDIRTIIKACYKQFPTNKCENLAEIDRILEKI